MKSLNIKQNYRFIQDNISKLWGFDGQNIGVQAVLGKFLYTQIIKFNN
jgi:hypothetical protein